jgi:signal transduction histidine kinase
MRNQTKKEFQERRSRVGRAVVLHIFFAILAPCPAIAQGDDAPSQLRILAIYSGSSTLVANVAIEAGIASVFSGAERYSRYEIYGEYRDAQRFPSDLDAERFVDGLVTKYRDQTIDVIMTIGPEAVPLAVTVRERIAPGAPVVLGGIVEGTRDEYAATEGLYAVVSRFDLRGTYELARQLQPEAERAVIFTGSAVFDESWKSFAEDALSDVTGIQIDYVSGLSLQAFRDRAAVLDPSDILIILTIFEDADGRRFVPADALASIAEVSAAPTYGVYSSNIGRGIAGGSFSTFEDTGAVIAEQALKILEDPSGAALSVPVPVSAVLDWRQLRRYGLDPERRPEGSELLFYDPGVWERYRLQILAALAIILLQSSTIAALIIIERRRRWSAEELSRRRMEMARLSRIAQLGELSGAIAHELNQPLTSILANAEAGSAMLAQDPPDLAEVGEVLRDIAEDDRRAADVIVNLRRLMVSGGAGFEDAELNEVVRSTLRLVSNEMLARGITVQLQLSRDALMVKGDVQQLQQVLLNLVINAADAMADQDMRHMTIATGLDASGRRVLSVADNGPGLPDKLRDNPFKPFATSKSQGMGLGLSISQTIAEAHGGTLRFVDSTREGACIELALPAP